MSKKQTQTEEVQTLDLTELVNYVNYLGNKLEEVSQVVQHPNIRFGLECIETESQLGRSKFFHYPVLDGFSSDLPKATKKFYLDKYGVIPELKLDDYYAF